MSSLYNIISSLFAKPEKLSGSEKTSTVKDLKEYKTRLYGSLSRDLSDFEKNFLLISAGILAFSITFIKDIVKIESALYISILFVSWLLIAISIGIMMFTFIRSAYASDNLWFIIDDFQAANNLFIDTDKIAPEDFSDIKRQTSKAFKKSKKQLKYMRLSAITLFLLGLSLFGFFTGINIYRENHNTKEINNPVSILYDTKTKKITIKDVKFSVTDTVIKIEK